MGDQNCTVRSTTEPPGSPAEKGGEAVPDGMEAVGVEAALNSVVVGEGEKSEADGSEMGVKKRRGRPRKYDVNGSLLLSPASAPLGLLDCSFGSSVTRGRGRPRGSGKLQLLASIGGLAADTAGGGFTPHVVTVNTGEDVVSRISLFSLRGPRAVCILSATGAVSSAIIRQPGSSGGILRFEGRFEIISLTGSYTAGGIAGGRRKTGMLSVLLANPDGRVFGGGVEGSLIAAGPIQLIVGSFKQNIGKEIKRRYSIGCSAATPNMPSHPKMVQGETTELMSTTNGLSDNVIPATSNGILDNVISTTSNGVLDNVAPASQNMHSISSNDGMSIVIDISEPRL